MEKKEIDKICKSHKEWLGGKEGREGANLRDANLQGADLRDADLDFSCLPIWCGGSRFKCSPSLVRQIFAHVCSLEVVGANEETTLALNAIRKEAEKSHRASDLDLI